MLILSHFRLAVYSTCTHMYRNRILSRGTRDSSAYSVETGFHAASMMTAILHITGTGLVL